MYILSSVDTPEKFTEFVDSKISQYKELLVGLYTLREFMPSIDGKIYNIRIRRAIDELPDLMCYEPSYGLLEVDLNNCRYSWNRVINFSTNILDEATGKRIDSNKAIEEIQKKVQEYRKNIASLEADRLDGWERLMKLMEIKEYYEKQAGNFSSEVGSEFYNDFRRVHIG